MNLKEKVLEYAKTHTEEETKKLLAVLANGTCYIMRKEK